MGLRTPTSPAARAGAVVPSDSTELVPLPRGLYVGTGGDVEVLLDEDTAPVTFKNVPDGAVLPVQAKKVMAATTASDILWLY